MADKHVFSRRVVGLLVVLASVAVGCGDSGSGDEKSAATTPKPTSSNVTIEAEGEPQYGGSLTYGLEAETDGWNPTAAQWAIAGTIVGMSIFDPLVMYDANGVPQPYLAKSITANENYTAWTVELREGVKFHDGEPLTSEAVKLALDKQREAAITGPIVAPIDRIETPDELTAVVYTTTPWSAFPIALTTQVGMIPAPAQLNDTTAASSTHPIGTGPFVFESWEQGERLVVTRNDDYWREGLPYLDRIEYRPIPDPETRAAAVDAGDVQIAHFDNPTYISELRARAAEGDFQILKDPSEPEELMVMFNQGQAPFDDVAARRAVQAATDVEAYLETMGAGVVERATGPYPESSPWYTATDWPDYNLERAKEAVADYEAEQGEKLSFTIKSTTKDDDRKAMELLKAQWAKAGIEVEIEYLEQASLIVDVITGNYEAADWRQWSAPDPDGDYIWWHSSTARPPGELSLNAGRLMDDQVDAALDGARTTLDQEERAEYYADFQRRLTELVPYVWLYHTSWSVVASNTVMDVTNGVMPDGQEALPMGGAYSGAHLMTQVWLVAD